MTILMISTTTKKKGRIRGMFYKTDGKKIYPLKETNKIFFYRGPIFFPSGFYNNVLSLSGVIKKD